MYYDANNKSRYDVLREISMAQIPKNDRCISQAAHSKSRVAKLRLAEFRINREILDTRAICGNGFPTHSHRYPKYQDAIRHKKGYPFYVALKSIDEESTKHCQSVDKVETCQCFVDSSSTLCFHFVNASLTLCQCFVGSSSTLRFRFVNASSTHY